MKLRWKEQEIFVVSILTIAAIVRYINDFFSPKLVAPGVLRYGNLQGNLRNVLMPQILSVLLLAGAYFFVLFLIIPAIKKISFKDVERLLSLTLLKAAAMIILLSIILSAGIKVLSFYARPWEVNYAGFGVLALFGYTEHPLSHVFSGLDRALLIILLMILLTGFREIISWLILRKNNGREFRVMITNNMTLLIYLYFLVLILINPSNIVFRQYVAYVTPSLAAYLYLSFRLFPMTEEVRILDRRIWLRLIILTVSCLAFFFVFYPAGPAANIRFLLMLIFIVYPATWLLYRLRADQIHRLRGVETALARSDADMQLLRSQINPHFLFNALNTLYGTALLEKAEKTSEGIQRLGDMMRFMLHENNQEQIAMQKEIAYLKNYIALQKLRIQHSPVISIQDNLDEVSCSGNIAPMLLIPFVENAFKHGISLQSPSWITVHLQCSHNELEFVVSNSIHRPGQGDPEYGKSGIGLNNITQRLKLLYPGKHNLYINQTSEKFEVKLILN